MSKIIIIGAGAMGSAFALPCLDNNHDINIVGTHLENNFIDNLQNNKNLHPGLNTIKGPCALTAMNVDYTSEGTYMTFEDGTMISYVVSLSFMELEPVYNSDYEQFGDDEIGF